MCWSPTPERNQAPGYINSTKAAGGTGRGIHCSRGLYGGKLFYLIQATLEIVGDPFSRDNHALGQAIKRALKAIKRAQKNR